MLVWCGLSALARASSFPSPCLTSSSPHAPRANLVRNCTVMMGKQIHATNAWSCEHHPASPSSPLGSSRSSANVRRETNEASHRPVQHVATGLASETDVLPDRDKPAEWKRASPHEDMKSVVELDDTRRRSHGCPAGSKLDAGGAGRTAEGDLRVSSAGGEAETASRAICKDVPQGSRQVTSETCRREHREGEGEGTCAGGVVSEAI